ncbi:MAG: hypothetical protein F6J99_04270 [Moorea sp. SIO4G3]|nr:hypothetical protein [Moorena sp. SIO4G3]
MLKRQLSLAGWLKNQPLGLLLATLMLITSSLFAEKAKANESFVASQSSVIFSQPLRDATEAIKPDLTEPYVQSDPLNSPYPIPWNWVLETHAELVANQSFGSRYYRSQSLVSPDGKYAAYSRIQLQAQPELYRSRISSVMFLENLQTGDLRIITASSPLANHINDDKLSGAISILIPVSWTESSDRLLGRQFEGFFNTSDASDYAVIWDRNQNTVTTLAPKRIHYTNALLLGWSQANPDQVLFQAGELGNEYWPMWSVEPNGYTALTFEDEPMVYGESVEHIWSGAQARW